MESVKIIECPRDAMQGLHDFIDTDIKAAYINLLLKAGFDTIDFGSFVSPKAIPQMRDTAEVLTKLELDGKTKLLAIIANLRGAEQAASFDEITYLGFPLSVSETFQQRNTNKSIEEAIAEVEKIQQVCVKNNKQLVTYISMGFGNPYGDPYNASIVEAFVEKLDKLGIRIVSLSDTIGLSGPDNIKPLFLNLIPRFPHIEFGAHLHTNPRTAEEKVDAAWEAGCRRFDGAIKGFGGCPMAKDELTGNMATETMLAYFDEKGIQTGINRETFLKALQMASSVFEGV
jgi:hydroxymethylglutaryl-CoA lyase